MKPLTAIKSCLAKSFQFSGRASRAEFWWFLPLPIAIFVITLNLADVFNALAVEAFLIPMLFVLFPALSFVMIAAGTRRLHDTGSVFGRVFQTSTLVCLAAYVGCIGLAIFQSYFLGASTEQTQYVGYFMILLWLPTVSLLMLCFAIPLARASQPGPNRYGPNPLEVTP